MFGKCKKCKNLTFDSVMKFIDLTFLKHNFLPRLPDITVGPFDLSKNLKDMPGLYIAGVNNSGDKCETM